jgi:hypothetical protein
MEHVSVLILYVLCTMHIKYDLNTSVLILYSAETFNCLYLSA